MAILVACALRRHEAVELKVSDLQHVSSTGYCGLGWQGFRRMHDLVPDWEKDFADDWLVSAKISVGKIFRRMTLLALFGEAGLTRGRLARG